MPMGPPMDRAFTKAQRRYDAQTPTEPMELCDTCTRRGCTMRPINGECESYEESPCAGCSRKPGPGCSECGEGK